MSLGSGFCRFDRQISIDRPDVTGREHMFRIHLAKLKLDKPLEYYSERMAALTPGFAGDESGTIGLSVRMSFCRSRWTCTDTCRVAGQVRGVRDATGTHRQLRLSHVAALK